MSSVLPASITVSLTSPKIETVSFFAGHAKFTSQSSLSTLS